MNVSLEFGAVRCTDILEEYGRHPLIKGRVFYVVPCGLLDCIVAEMGRDVLTPDCAKLDIALSQQCADDPEIVGYRNGLPIYYPLLLGRRAARLDASGASTSNVPASVERLFADNDRVRRDYAGWLTVNPVYLAERDAYGTRWANFISLYGVPTIGLGLSGKLQKPALGELTEDAQLTAFANEFAVLCSRWRLRGIITYELPDPLEPQLGGADRRLLPPALVAEQELSWRPTIFPATFGRDHDLAEARRQDDETKHLNDWFALTGPERSNNQQMDRYGRIFKVQHYWHVLAQRHPALLEQRTKLIEAFGQYLGVEPRTIQNGIHEITQRVGLP